MFTEHLEYPENTPLTVLTLVPSHSIARTFDDFKLDFNTSRISSDQWCQSWGGCTPPPTFRLHPPNIWRRPSVQYCFETGLTFVNVKSLIEHKQCDFISGDCALLNTHIYCSWFRKLTVVCIFYYLRTGTIFRYETNLKCSLILMTLRQASYVPCVQQGGIAE